MISPDEHKQNINYITLLLIFNPISVNLTFFHNEGFFNNLFQELQTGNKWILSYSFKYENTNSQTTFPKDLQLCVV